MLTATREAAWLCQRRHAFHMAHNVMIEKGKIIFVVDQDSSQQVGRAIADCA